MRLITRRNPLLPRCVWVCVLTYMCVCVFARFVSVSVMCINTARASALVRPQEASLHAAAFACACCILDARPHSGPEPNRQRYTPAWTSATMRPWP